MNLRGPILTLGAVACIAVLFIAAIFGYMQLFPTIDAASPHNFEANTQEALDAGDYERAAKIARIATQAPRYDEINHDPMANTSYARALFKLGDDDAALEQLDIAVSERPEPWSPYVNDRTRYYFAPARLTLGRYYVERQDWWKAVENFELARAYRHEHPEAFENYKEDMYRAYAAVQMWARALEYGRPKAPELEGMEKFESSRLRHVLNARSDHPLHNSQVVADLWDFVEETANEDETTRPDEDDAGEAMKIPEGESLIYVYRAIALAFGVDGEFESSKARKELLDRVIEEMRLNEDSAMLESYVPYRRYNLLSIRYSDGYFDAGSRFPVLTLWEDREFDDNGDSTAQIRIPEADPRSPSIRVGRTVLQLQWVDNLVNWSSVDLLPEGADVVPGWIDTAREWFGMIDDGAAAIIKEDENSLLRIENQTWFYSCPVRVTPGANYFLAGRVRGGEGAGIAWQAMDSENEIVFEGTLPGAETGGWAAQAGYLCAPHDWAMFRVHLASIPGLSGDADFDDVMLIEIKEPSGI